MVRVGLGIKPTERHADGDYENRHVTVTYLLNVTGSPEYRAPAVWQEDGWYASLPAGAQVKSYSYAHVRVSRKGWFES